MEFPISNELPMTSPSSAGQDSKVKPGKKKKQSEPLPLRFITSTGSSVGSKGDVEVRRLIRAHARRSGAHKSEEKSTSERSTEIGHNEAVKYDKKLHTSRFKLSTWSRTPSKKNESENESDNELKPSEEEVDLYTILEYLKGNGTIPQPMDPLNPLPVPFLPQIKRLLQFCKWQDSATRFLTNKVEMHLISGQILLL